MPVVNDTPFPDNVRLSGAIVTAAHQTRFEAVISAPFGEPFETLIRKRMEGPFDQTTSTTMTVVLAYGRGWNEERMRPFVGDVVDIDVRVSAIMDQKTYRRRLRLFAQAVTKK